MTELTEWIKTDLYPALFNNLERALPEHKLKRSRTGWESKHRLRGEDHSREDKTKVLESAPGWIFEEGGNSLSLVDYVMERDHLPLMEAVKKLADISGVEVPGGSVFDPESYQRAVTRGKILEDANKYFTWCLENSPGAEAVRGYLEARGYPQEDIKAMELGFIPSQEQLFKRLQELGYSQTAINELSLQVDTRIGTSHRLTIPYRSSGQIRGFKFRTIGDETPKYLNSHGLDRSGGFFNLSTLRGDKDLVIVEGELDALHATAKGIKNIVATGGSSVNPGQIRDAIKRGARMFTICFDREPGKEEETSKKVNRVIEVILAEGVNRVYIATLPDLDGKKTDPDRMVKEMGADALREVLYDAVIFYQYRLRELVKKYVKKEEESGKLTDKDQRSLLDEAVVIGAGLDPMDRDRYKKLFISNIGNNLGVTGENYQIAVEKLTATKAKEDQDKALRDLIAGAKKLQEDGDPDGALGMLEKKLGEVKAKTGKGLLPPVMSYSSLMADIAKLDPAHKTGYPSLDSFVGFTPGAITLVAGRPSHGKTTLLFNLLLEMSNGYPRENFYFFTYEEPVKNLSVKILNRLTATDLSPYFGSARDLARGTNYEFIKSYIREGRTDIAELENGKRLLQDLVDSQRIKLIDRNYSVEELHKLVMYLSGKEKIGGVFIDYIQRMRTDRRTQDKRTEIAHISDMVLQMAKESGLPIILGAQLNRQGKEKPTLENLKEAGNLEEDANTVLSVYNDSRENLETYKNLSEVDLEITALKNREGEVNRSSTLTFDKWTGVIKDQRPF